MVDRLVNENMGLAQFFANKYSAGGVADYMERDEALSRAMCGLMRAAQLFKPELGRFGAYAGLYIKRSLNRFFQDGTRSKRGGKHAFTLNVSIDAPVGSDPSGGLTLSDILVDENSSWSFNSVNGHHDAEEINEWVSELDPKEKSVIIFRFGLAGDEPKTLSEAGKIMKLSRERVRQIEVQAIKKLRFISKKVVY